MGRRHSGYGGYDGSTPKSKLDVGEDHVMLRESNGQTKVAKILERRTAEGGAVESLLLDRVIHTHESIEGWAASGCFVTELTPK